MEMVMMNRYIPPITRRVLAAVALLVVGIVTNAWHKNIASQLVVSITAIALAFWLGGELPKGKKLRDDDSQP
jgi:uncharacterized membrane protein